MKINTKLGKSKVQVSSNYRNKEIEYEMKKPHGCFHNFPQFSSPPRALPMPSTLKFAQNKNLKPKIKTKI